MLNTNKYILMNNIGQHGRQIPSFCLRSDGIE
jgi:hypothetical protein